MSASISVTDDDFMVVAMAANQAQRDGDDVRAAALDKIARKMNAALSTESTKGYRWMGSGQRHKVSWRDMPSTLVDR